MVNKDEPALRRLLTTAERPNLVRLDGIAIAVLGALKGAFSFVIKRTWTRLDASSISPSMSIT